MALFMAFGVAFEVPVAIILLCWSGVTSPEDLKKKRPYVLVGAFVVGMLLTPPDVFSQTLLAVPMYLLFEVGCSSLVSIPVNVARRRKKKTRVTNPSTLIHIDCEAAHWAAFAGKTMFDIGVNLTSSQFAKDRQAVVERARVAGVTGC